MDTFFIEDQANALARKAYEFITHQRQRGAKPQTPGKALVSASWATIGGKFKPETRALIKKRARTILKKLLQVK